MSEKNPTYITEASALIGGGRTHLERFLDAHREWCAVHHPVMGMSRECNCGRDLAARELEALLKEIATLRYEALGRGAFS